MKKLYIGTKMLKAEPMTLGAYNELRKWKIPENENPEREGYIVQYDDGYISWSPKEVFARESPLRIHALFSFRACAR